jgi:hypothetical protein
MSDLDMADFWVHTAAVETFAGVNGYGVDTFAAPVTITCLADDSRKLVRNAAGEQVISETTLYTSILNAALFTPDTRVTVLGDADNDELNPSQSARVIKVNGNDSGALNLPDHLAVSLT